MLHPRKESQNVLYSSATMRGAVSATGPIVSQLTGPQSTGTAFVTASFPPLPEGHIVATEGTLHAHTLRAPLTTLVT